VAHKWAILVSEISIFLWTHPEQYSLSHPLLLIGHPCWNPCNTDQFSIDFEPVPSTWRWRQLVPLNHQCRFPSTTSCHICSLYYLDVLTVSNTPHTTCLLRARMNDLEDNCLYCMYVYIRTLHKTLPNFRKAFLYHHIFTSKSTISQTKGGLLCS
jgi:hypothetical protein